MISFELASLHRLEKILKNLLDNVYRDESKDERITITLTIRNTGVERITLNDVEKIKDDADEKIGVFDNILETGCNDSGGRTSEYFHHAPTNYSYDEKLGDSDSPTGGSRSPLPTAARLPFDPSLLPRAISDETQADSFPITFHPERHRPRTIFSLKTRCFSMIIDTKGLCFDKEELYRSVSTKDRWFYEKIKDYRSMVERIRDSTDIALRERYELFSLLDISVLYAINDDVEDDDDDDDDDGDEKGGRTFFNGDRDRTRAFLSLFADCLLLFVAFPLTCSDMDVNFLVSNNFTDVLIAQNDDEFELALRLDASAYLRTRRRLARSSSNERFCKNYTEIETNALAGEPLHRVGDSAAGDGSGSVYGERINFVIYGNNVILNVDSREPRRTVRIKEIKTRTESSSAIRSVKRKFYESEKNYRTDDKTDTRQRDIPCTASIRHSLSKEQLDIIRLYENLRGTSRFCKRPPPPSSSSSSTTSPRVALRDVGKIFENPKIRCDNRLIIDGVAGAGKTFVLGYYLERFKIVRYLVKKRMFVQNVKNRFPYAVNLRTSTIDSFLMKSLGVRDLNTWLDALKTSMDSLRQDATRRCLRHAKDTLYFVDEFGQMEGKLALLLNILLRDSNVILVGDTNQQSAINENIQCPVQTLLGYRNIAFMYENTRAKDSDLLRRLSQFYFKRKDESIIERVLNGLPATNLINLQPFLDSFHRDEYDYSLLPKIIVTSNEQMNYVNWAIGKILWIHARPNKKLKYTREIVRSVEKISVFNGFAGIRADSGEVVEKRLESSDLTDDPYADEHFVLVGMYYRVISHQPSYPFEIGTRVIVTRIESDTAVWVKRATVENRGKKFGKTDNREIRITKHRVKPYEFKSIWHSMPNVEVYMFPFVCDQATTVYQIQGITISEKECSRCYIDAYRMDERSLYVALSRFESERQIAGVINSCVS